MPASASVYLVFVLVTLSVGGIIFAVFEPRIAQAAQARRRLGLLVGSRPAASSGRGGGAGKPRRRSIEDTLKEIEEKQKAKARSRARPTLAGTLRQGGLEWSMMTYWSLCAGLGAGTCSLAWLGLGLKLSAAVPLGALLGLVLPRLYVRHRRNRRFRAFAEEFPNAVDVIVRGVKSGLPLPDCLRIIAAEGQEPVRGEFRGIVDDQTLGVTLPEAVQRLADRVPLPETNFLATVVAIQNQAGGNLTEALGNLSVVLRERRKMRVKIKALSAEAKASAGIIGALPPVVGGTLYLTSPDYIMLLFNTLIGQMVLVASLLWMVIGLLVMRAMINFDF
jgi:tight adherence protein B